MPAVTYDLTAHLARQAQWRVLPILAWPKSCMKGKALSLPSHDDVGIDATSGSALFAAAGAEDLWIDRSEARVHDRVG